ncbi:hypothetical protein QYI97_10560 [Lacticaseibacillus paracasei]|uniref:hypothetical protein n=1 Tax=Lacticaseibacillus paracasei TaxID=1597 RepID=UPI002636D581|nr:hypothetical protein [Lacticaseibacillus paracasei]MDN4554665.1 hypothetical protein [Lacticaseibacillus paracasei]
MRKDDVERVFEELIPTVQAHWSEESLQELYDSATDTNGKLSIEKAIGIANKKNVMFTIDYVHEFLLRLAD